jgi:hypothetical protein
VTAFPMLARCAERQYGPDHALYLGVLRDQHAAQFKLSGESIKGPNLWLETAPWGSDERVMKLVLELKVG